MTRRAARGKIGGMKTPYPILEPPPPQQENTDNDATDPSPLSHLTVEEQMALFEAELKFNDWGHQPC